MKIKSEYEGLDGAMVWEKVVEYVKGHEDEIFTKTGDFRKSYLIDPEKIKNIFVDR